MFATIVQSNSFILFFLILLSNIAFGQSSDRKNISLNPDYIDINYFDIKKYNLNIEEKFITSNKNISIWLDQTAEKIDLFLVNESKSKSKNETSVQLQNNTYSNEGRNFLNETNLIINPRFPNLEKYWNLKFSTYDQQETERKNNNAIDLESAREKNYGATIGLFKKFGGARVLFQPRIELKNSLSISHSLSTEASAEFVGFSVQPKFEFFASASKGAGLFQALNFNFFLVNDYALNLIFEGAYEDKLNKYSLTNGLVLIKKYSLNNQMSYGFLTYANNRDNYHLEAYSLWVSWYHLIYKNILDFKLTPKLDFTKNLNFKGTAGLNFDITLSF